MTVIFVDYVKSLKRDDGTECDSDSECIPSTDCQYYKDQQDLLKSLTDKALKVKGRLLVLVPIDAVMEHLECTQESVNIFNGLNKV